MSRQTIQLDDEVLAYVRDVSLRETDLQRELREVTADRERSQMQISAEQGQFMTLLVELTGVDRALEIGTYTGYSAMSIVRGMREGGELIACDVDAETTAVARDFWQRAGIAENIDLRLQPAAETLDELLEAGRSESFEFAFIDADKENYELYYERCLELLAPGGLVAIDNALWSGSVADPEIDDAATEAIRAVNRTVAGDERVTPSLVPIGDGVFLARKRPTG